MTKIWSHSYAQSIVELSSPEAAQAREILSRRYANTTLLLLPLSSGAFAILDRGFALIDVVEEVPGPEALREMSEEAAKRLRKESEQRQQRPASAAGERQKIVATLEDLGL